MYSGLLGYYLSTIVRQPDVHNNMINFNKTHMHAFVQYIDRPAPGSDSGYLFHKPNPPSPIQESYHRWQQTSAAANFVKSQCLIDSIQTGKRSTVVRSLI